MFVLLQAHAEGRVELRDRAGEHDRAPRLVTLDDRQSVLLRERMDRRQVRAVRAEMLRELVVIDMLRRRALRRERADVLRTHRASAVARAW